MAFFVGQKAVEAFDERYMPEPNTGCWFWLGTCNDRGYGIIQLTEYRGYAHRFSYERFKGPIPAGAHICHKCDTPLCVNPDHLFAGSQTDNMQDCVRKGRHASHKSSTRYARGTAAGRAKLTEMEVRAIRALVGLASQRKIASQFGVTKNVIKLIHQGRTWRHV